MRVYETDWLGFGRAEWLWLNVSPALPITFAYLFLLCMSSFIKASVSDPGVCLSIH